MGFELGMTKLKNDASKVIILLRRLFSQFYKAFSMVGIKISYMNLNLKAAKVTEFLAICKNLVIPITDICNFVLTNIFFSTSELLATNAQDETRFMRHGCEGSLTSSCCCFRITAVVSCFFYGITFSSSTSAS